MSDVSGCAGCGRAVDVPGQKFCPSCGQPTPVHRIDWHFMAHELEHSVLHMDRGLLYSLKELMLRPGRLMRDYLEGRRARQAKPFLLLMVSAAAIVFLGKYVSAPWAMSAGLQASDFQAMATDARTQAMLVAVADANAQVQGWIGRNFALSTLLLIPLEALAFRIAFIGTRRLNYPEWLVVTAFLTVQTFVFMGIALLLQRWVPAAPGIAIGVALCYGVYSLVRLFAGASRLISTLRAMVGFGLYLVASAVLTSAAVVVLIMLQPA